MRRTLNSLKSLEHQLTRLEREASGAGELSGQQQVDMLNDALFDHVAARKFEAAYASGRILPFLFRLYQLQGAGPCTGNCDHCNPELCPRLDRKADVQ
jgi:hypothetical protein